LWKTYWSDKKKIERLDPDDFEEVLPYRERVLY